MEVTSTTALSLMQHIVNLVKERGWDISKMMGFGSDGAAVMVGE